MPSLRDVTGITETWWENSHDGMIRMDGYKLFQKDRKGTRGGEIALYVKEKIVCRGELRTPCQFY